MRAEEPRGSDPDPLLKGVSTGDFEGGLVALLGKDAGGLSAATIARLKETWSAAGASAISQPSVDIRAHRPCYLAAKDTCRACDLAGSSGHSRLGSLLVHRVKLRQRGVPALLARAALLVEDLGQLLDRLSLPSCNLGWMLGRQIRNRRGP